jgi:hypothetical protein
VTECENGFVGRLIRREKGGYLELEAKIIKQFSLAIMLEAKIVKRFSLAIMLGEKIIR